MAFERIAEQKIREATQAGEFDNLPNAGSRIDLEGYFSLPEHSIAVRGCTPATS